MTAHRQKIALAALGLAALLASGARAAEPPAGHRRVGVSPAVVQPVGVHVDAGGAVYFGTRGLEGSRGQYFSRGYLGAREWHRRRGAPLAALGVQAAPPVDILHGARQPAALYVRVNDFGCAPVTRLVDTPFGNRRTRVANCGL